MVVKLIKAISPKYKKPTLERILGRFIFFKTLYDVSI